MSSCLNQCKIVIQKCVPYLRKFVKEKLNIKNDLFEIQIVGYRNYNAPADLIVQSCAFTSDENELTKFIHSLKPTYGWGSEAVEVALGQLNRQQKKPNIIMLISDAPAQTKEEIKNKRADSSRGYGEKYWQKERGGIFKESLDSSEELNKYMYENNNASVFCFYLTNYAKANFDEIANIGKGKSMYLDINDGEKSVDLLYA
eukprot:275207_1